MNLFQERYQTHPWRLLCCCVCLNLCTGRALESVHEDLFALWPTPEAMADASDDLEVLLSQLGLQNVRARNLRRLAAAFPLWDGRNPRDLPGVGEYGSDSYRIFIKGEIVEPKDKELKKYLAWLASSPKPYSMGRKCFCNPCKDFS